MPRVHWKLIVTMFVVALGVRWGLTRLQVAEEPVATAITHAQEEEGVELAERGGAAAPVTTESGDAPATGGPLTFDHDPVDVKPRPEQEEITVTFDFTNTSGKPVTITGMDSTCSCLEASLDQRTYAPGGRGSGKAVFKVTSFVGRHEKTLHLFTDHPEAPEQVLTFVLDVPVVVSIEPNLLEWTVGEAAEPKTMVIKMVGDDPMRITKITPTRENVRYELKEVTPGREYHLVVTPTTTKDVTIGGFKIETDSSIPKYSRQMAFFSIVREELAEKKEKAAAEKKDTPSATP